MAIELARPRHIVVRAPSSGLSTRTHTDEFARSSIDAIVRSLLIGLGISVTISLGHTAGFISIATVGILAIGAALASWSS